MPTIDISEEQYEYLESLRAELSARVGGKYAHVGLPDAVQYLIDNYEDSVDPVAMDAMEKRASMDADAGTASTDRAVAASGQSVESSAAPDAAEQDSEAGATGDDAEDESATEMEDESASETEDEPSAAEDESSDGEDEDGSATESADDSEGAGGGAGPSRLKAMMSLLDDHDDKWEQVDSEQGRYLVDLPDGTTEHAQTKDDVRALLFKHY